MAAKIDFYGGCEPAELEAVRNATNERRFGEVHLGGDGLHPGCVAIFV
jgi:hypothetical protein